MWGSNCRARQLSVESKSERGIRNDPRPQGSGCVRGVFDPMGPSAFKK